MNIIRKLKLALTHSRVTFGAAGVPRYCQKSDGNSPSMAAVASERRLAHWGEGGGGISPKKSRIAPLSRSDLPPYQTIGQQSPRPAGDLSRLGSGEKNLAEPKVAEQPSERARASQRKGLPRHSEATAGEGESFERECHAVHGEGERLSQFSASSHIGASRLQRAFTLIELLVVIAIIAILAAMLIPVFGVAMTHARKTQAKLQAGQISSAIEQYESQYSRMPVSSFVQQSGSNNVTYGGYYTSTTTTPANANEFPNSSWGSYWAGPALVTLEGLYVTNNSDVMAILLDLTNYPNTNVWTVNTNYQKNPMRTVFLNGSYSSDTISPGIGTDLNYRDPWGNPYIITMDLNEDNKAEDAFYAPYWMSSSTGAAGGAGVNGLSYQAADNSYLFHGNVMVWSMGPNGPANHAPSSFTYPPSASAPPGGGAWARESSNKNHVLSWGP
jgi:prepilin-type N-terminal cleavage/methylation domain-containing protein